MKNFGSRLYNLIKHTDLTQKDFAAKISITEQALTNYLNNRLPKADVLIKIQQTFNASIDWLLTGKGEMLRSEIKAPDIKPGELEKRLLELLDRKDRELLEKDMEIQELRKKLKSEDSFNIAAEDRSEVELKKK